MSGEIERFLSFVSATAKENTQFFDKNAKRIASEVVELVNDAIDSMILFAKQKSNEIYVRQSLAFYVNHILLPTTYSILISFLVGNVATCFRDIRFLIESLAKCYLADLKYSDQSIYQVKLELLRKERKKRNNRLVRKREHDFIGEFDSELHLNRKCVKLWGRLSAEVHTWRYVERIVDHVIEKSDIPVVYRIIKIFRVRCRVQTEPAL